MENVYSNNRKLLKVQNLYNSAKLLEALCERYCGCRNTVRASKDQTVHCIGIWHEATLCSPPAAHLIFLEELCTSGEEQILLILRLQNSCSPVCLLGTATHAKWSHLTCYTSADPVLTDPTSLHRAWLPVRHAGNRVHKRPLARWRSPPPGSPKTTVWKPGIPQVRRYTVVKQKLAMHITSH